MNNRIRVSYLQLPNLEELYGIEDIDEFVLNQMPHVMEHIIQDEFAINKLG